MSSAREELTRILVEWLGEEDNGETDSWFNIVNEILRVDPHKLIKYTFRGNEKYPTIEMEWKGE